MKRLVLSVSAAVLVLGLGVRGSSAQITLQDQLFNVNGTAYGDFSASGMDTSDLVGFSAGNGTLTFTYDPGSAGSYYFDAAFDFELGIPFYNEFGSTGNTGSLGAGYSWEIGDYGNWESDTPPDPFDDALTNSLNGTNELPQGASNFLGTCTGAGCNSDADFGMGYSFVLGSGEEEIITMTTSTTAPSSGFYIEQTHPVDPGNPTEVDMYFQMSGVEAASGSNPPPPPPPSTIPEPSTWLMFATGMGAGLTQLRRKINL